MVDQIDSNSASFEEAFRSLQDIVERLERGNLPLEESLALFELGTALANRCAALLDQAEMRIRALCQNLPGASANAISDNRSADSICAETDDDSRLL